MALSIKNDTADLLARQLCALTGKTLTNAVILSLRERLERQRAQGSSRPLAERLMEIGRHCASLPVIDDRSPEEIIGYDDNGLPR
jgi:antitoxin VapB